VKLFNPETPAITADCVKPARKKHSRCRCGCGKAAYWPRDGRPVFHTRLCGYLMAVRMFRQRKA
jgi:hypothetical protein